MANVFDQFDQPAPAPRQSRGRVDPDAIARGAAELGIDPVDLATAISYETAGTFDPDKAGPTTKWGQHRGLIQFGEPQRAKYGVRPGMSFAEQMPAVVSYLRDAGVQPGMSLLDVYSAINAGAPGRYNARDAAAGGAPGTVAEKVRTQMADHRRKAMQVLGYGGEGGGGGTGGYAAGGNPFDQFDAPAPAPDITQAFRQQRADREIAARQAPVAPPSPAVQPGSTIPADGDYRSVFAPEDQSTFGKIGLRALVGRVPTLAGNLIDLPGNVAGAISDALPGDSMTATLLRETFNRAGQAVRDVGYEREMESAGYGVPSVSGSQVVEAVNPMADVPLLERAARIGTFVPETLLGSSADMIGAVGALPAYLGARTNEVAENRAANDMRDNPSLTDIAIAAPTATAESLLERATTMRLLPGGAGAAVRPGAAAAAGRVARETGIQGATGAIEEAIPYLAERVGTETPATQQGLVESLVGGLLAEGGLGGGAQGASEIARALAPNVPAAPAPIQEPVPQAAAAEGVAAPRQGEAPAAPPAPVRQEAQQAPEAAPPAPVEAAAPPRPDMQAATRSIDDRLASLDEAAAAQIDESEVSALNAERQELDDLVREQDRARREGIVQPLESRLSPEERATADARRQEIAATLERHRAARTAADQAERLRSRLEAADTDAALYDIAREINPTLGTPQAESFRSSEVKNNSTPEMGPSSSAAIATPSVSEAGSTTALPDTPSVAAQVPASTSRTEPQQNQDVLSNSLNQKEITTQKASQKAPDVADQRGVSLEAPAAVSEPARAEAPRQPMAGTGDLRNSSNPAPRPESQREPAPPAAPAAPARTTSLKNAVTDAERIAEGLDPIIREARKANRETVDEAVDTLRKTPSIGRETAKRLAEGGPVELKDEAILLVHKVDLRKRRDAAAERAQDPNASEEARAIARAEYDDAVQQIDEVDMAARRVGTESGRLLQLRKRMIAEDYSLPALERKLQMVVNRDLKPAERAELAEMATKVADLQRKLDAVESQQASAQVAEMLARLMKQAPGRGATLAQRRTAAAESKAALSAMAQAGGQQQSIAPASGQSGQARAAIAERLGRGVVARLERAGVLEFDDRSGGTWDGVRIGIGNVAPENALGVLLHEVSHANMLDVMGEQGYERALRDLDKLEAAGDMLALRAKRRADKSGETGQRLDDERIAYMVEEATNAQKRGVTVSEKAADFLRSVMSAFRRWAATSPVFRALEKIGVSRPVLKPADFAAFARKGLDRMVADAKNPESAGLRGKVRELENQLRTDTMTGMKNRRAFDEDEALGWPTVAAIDMDGLGKLNEAVGHEAADKVLKALADTFMAAENDSIRVYRHTGGDELAVRFKNAADADRVMADLQQQLDGMNVEMDVTGADGVTRSFTYEGIGITYGTGATYEQADAVAGRRKTEREQAGLRQSKQDPGPSRRVRENSPRPGGRREGDPPAVGAQLGASTPPDVFGPVPSWATSKGPFPVSLPDGTPVFARILNAKNNDIYSTGNDPDNIEFITADGYGVGNLTYGTTESPRGRRVEPKVYVDEAWRRRGVATTLYRVAAENGGLIPPLDSKNADRTEEGVAFRDGISRKGFDPSKSKKPGQEQRSIPEGEDAAPAGADPVAFFHLAQLGAFHYADGAQDIGEWTRRMEADLGAAAGRFRSMLPDAFKAAKAQASKPVSGQESVTEAVEAIGDQRRPRDVKRVVRAVVSEGMRGEDAIIAEAARVLDMEDADVRSLFVQSESKARTLTEAQAELQQLRRQLRAAQRPDPETRYQNQRARDFQRRIAELEERIAAGDFAKRERVERELRTENQRLQFELEKAKERFHRYAIAAEFAQRTPLRKLWGETYAGINFARAIMTALDLSAVFRQGGFITLGHPGRAAKGIMPMLRAFASEQADFEAMQDIQNRPNAPLYKKYGLQLTGIGGDALTHVEEAYASRWVDQWSKWAGGGLIRGSGRAYTAFLNRLRADSFDAMLAALARNGEKPTKEEGEAIANYINVATGRGSLGGKNPGEVLTAVFFAPRLVASRFELLAGQPLYGGSNRTRAMILKEYARFLTGVAVAVTLAAMMRDEDDETKVFELDPRSANFGKVRFGEETFLDPLVGLAQVTVFLSRVLSGETRTTTTGALKPLRDEYRLTDVAPGLGDGRALGKVGYGGRDIPDVIASFLRSKLAPVPGAIINVATGENMIGEKVTPLSAAGELVTPMSVGSLVDVLESQGMARGTAINLLGILGMSVQYRKSDAEKAAEEAGGLPGKIGIGRAPEAANGE